MFGFNRRKEPKAQLITPSVVKPGDIFFIEYYRIQGGSGDVECLNNSPENKTIYIQINWVKPYPKERLVLDYRGKELANFHLLNKDKYLNTNKQEPRTDIISLQKELNLALENEEYEKADKLQKQIDSLIKK